MTLYFNVELQKCMLSLFLEVKQVKLEGLVSTHFTPMNSQLFFLLGHMKIGPGFTEILYILTPKGELHQFDTLKYVYGSWGVQLHM